MKLALTSPMSKAKTWTLGTFSALSVADVVTTLYFTTKWGTESEANLLMRWVLDNAGAGGFIACKCVVVAGLWGLRKHIATWVIVGGCVIMVPVVVQNIAMCML